MYNSTFYFRAREQNASIYRISADNRKSRDIYDHVGTVVYQSGKIKPQDGASFTSEEENEIAEWVSRHKTRLNKIAKTKAEELIVDVNHVAHWIQSSANDKQITEIFEDLVLALHDLRQTAVRRYAKALQSESGETEDSIE